jgi:uncharacterized phiE125 gp8 family phage protein
MKTEIKTISTQEPVNLDEAKNHLRIDHDEDNDYIRDLVRTARERAEQFCNRSFIQKKLALYLFEWAESVPLKPEPVASIVSVEYKNTSDVWTVYSNYSAEKDNHVQLLTKPANMIEEKGYNAIIRITFNVGYVDTVDRLLRVPQSVKQAILMMVRTMYDNREDVIRGMTINRVPENSEYLLGPYRIYEFK